MQLAGSENVAVTPAAADTTTVQVAAVPLQLPADQPAKMEPVPAAAVRVTEVPEAKFAAQVDPQLIPAGEEVTAPDPLPLFFTVSVWLVFPALSGQPMSLNMPIVTGPGSWADSPAASEKVISALEVLLKVSARCE